MGLFKQISDEPEPTKPPLITSVINALNILGLTLADVFLYFADKLKRVLGLVSKVYRWVSKLLLVVKRWLMKNMFWGRGDMYRYFTQAATIGVFLLVIVVGTVNKPITESILLDTEYSYYAGVAERDLLVATGSVETLIPQERSAIEMIEYTVKKGDTLSTIAAAYGISEDTIKWANNLTSVHILNQGTVLKIPPGDGIIYEVGKGDSVESIADEYKVSAQAIVDMNWLDPPFNLKVGDSLFIPDAKMPAPPPPVSNPGNVSYPNSGTAIDVALNPVDPYAGRFLSWPTSGSYRVTQCPSWYHVAVDMADGTVPDILAAADGTVFFAGWKNDGYGWRVQIAHENGYTTLYAHMQALYVVSGQYVTAGTAVGKMGATGNSTGIHLHFELRKGKEYANRINPSPYMQINICGY